MLAVGGSYLPAETLEANDDKLTVKECHNIHLNITHKHGSCFWTGKLLQIIIDNDVITTICGIVLALHTFLSVLYIHEYIYIYIFIARFVKKKKNVM